MIDIKKIAEQINEIVETNEKEIRTELVKNLTDKSCSYLMRDIYDEKNIKDNNKPYNMTEVISAILWLTPNDQIKNILSTLPHVTLNKIKTYTEKIIEADSLYAFILRRDTIINKNRLSGDNYTTYESNHEISTNKNGLSGVSYKTYDFDHHILTKLCDVYVQKYDLSDDLKDIDFYKNDIAYMYEIDRDELNRNGKNKQLFDHFEKCIKDILNE